MNEAEILILDRDAARTAELLAALARLEPPPAARSMDPEIGAPAADSLAAGAVVVLNAMDASPEVNVSRIRELKHAHPSARILVCGVPEEGERLIGYLEAGAWGYALATAGPDNLLHTIEAMWHGESPVSAKVGGRLIRRIHEVVRREGWPGWEALDSTALTPRERDILRLIARRWTNREIAEELVLEVGTVKNHVHNVLKKLQVESREQAADAGLQLAWIAEASSDDRL